MAYQIKVDDYVLDDPRDDELSVQNPKCNLEANKVGEASFDIVASHPYYSKLRKKRSIFEIRQDNDPIFRGRMTEDTKDFNNIKMVDLEGVLSFFNDSIIRPFSFPEDFLEDADYITAANSGNVVKFFLSWLIDQHNSQVQEFQRFKLGVVTVADPNNYLSRSNKDYLKTWEILKTRLFESEIGGFLCIRYEADGNYIDYLEDFELTNAQPIKYGENLLDLTSNSDASETYSAIIPLGKRKNEIDTESEDDTRLTIADLPDGNITDDIVKVGDTIYSKSAVAEYGWVYAPPEETTWEDVGEAANLQTKGVDFLTKTGMKLANTITIKAVDLHYSDEEIESFRIYRYIQFESKPHEQDDMYRLTRLELDIHNPQNTVITIGDTQLSLTDINAGIKQNATSKAESVKVEVQNEVNHSLSAQETAILAKTEELYNTKIEQLSKSITFELSGSLGNKASIKLAIGGKEYKDEIELSKVREAFANDNTAVTISAGVITFNSGTIVINSNNFKVDAQGVIEATSGTVGGWTLKNYKLYAGDGTNIKTVVIQAPTSSNLYVFAAGGTSHDSYADCPFRVTKAGKLYATDAIITGSVVSIDSPYKTELDFGSLRLYWNDDLCGTVNTKYWSGASTAGISLRCEEGGKYIMFSHADDTQGSGYTVDYYLNAGWSSNYDEMHIFQTSARFLDDAYFAGKTRIRSLRLFDADGEYLVGVSDGQLTVSKL